MATGNSNNEIVTTPPLQLDECQESPGNGRHQEDDQAISINRDVKECMKSLLSSLGDNLRITEQTTEFKDPTQQRKSTKRRKSSRNKKSKRNRTGGCVINTGPKFYDFYKVLREIAHGRFGLVKLCVHKVTGVQYAVKQITIDSHRYYRTGRVFVEREIRICRQLRHPNLITLVESFIENRIHYLVFKFIPGGELRYDIVERTTYSELDASHCIEQILQGVAYLHRNEIIHRDLKPKNILLTDKCKDVIVKIADFGLAIEMEGAERARFGIVGTLVFKPPEVYRDDVYGTPVDLWACGAMLYLMLFGRLPFDGHGAEEVYDQIDAGLDFPAACQGVPDVGTDAKDLVKQMLSEDQDDRITAEDALDHPFLEKWRNVASRFHRHAALERHQNFNGKRKFKSASLAVMFATILSRKFESKFPEKSYTSL